MSEDDDIKEGEFIVEKILQVREIQSRRWYLIKWEGRPQSESTWEPEENCRCAELISEFWERVGRSSLVSHSENISTDDTKEGAINNPEELPYFSHNSSNVEVPDAGGNDDKQVDKEEEDKETDDQCEKSEEESSDEEMEEEEKVDELEEKDKEDRSPSDRESTTLTRSGSTSFRGPFSSSITTESGIAMATKMDEETLENLNMVETNMEADERRLDLGCILEAIHFCRNLKKIGHENTSTAKSNPLIFVGFWDNISLSMRSKEPASYGLAANESNGHQGPVAVRHDGCSGYAFRV
ncbi:hypothetical protein Aperf_G00000017491 [Anoplocephala perfoliata]